MPFWNIYHSTGVFTDQDKAAIARGATEFYSRAGLPAFYVHTLFTSMERENSFTGGKLHSTPFVLIEVAHVARNWDGKKEHAEHIKKGIDRVMMPFTTDKGIHLEYAVLEGPAALWRIDGVDPPEAFGPDDKDQAEVNRKILAGKYRSSL
ncbi:Tautomerase [Akanthomyces lecanii RCEF 1005]|uniref:Tautomerase n=1 Tax=Akanthomyces lecanii RCEF 1005 TaxID=1081108 RepID=A0A168FAS4_CORDF|nr:Tautomerase [Akanthomyces lecanii RCEF 1005]